MLHWIVTGAAGFAAWKFTENMAPAAHWGITLAVVFLVWGFMSKQNGGE